MIDFILKDTGGINQWLHNRVPTPLDHQPIIRQNRDTIYSAAIVDVSAGATLTLPDAGDRYLSAMIISQDHYVPHIFHGAGVHQLHAKGNEPVMILPWLILIPFIGGLLCWTN